jgi:hypothetical protein
MTEATENSSTSDGGREPIALPGWLPPAAAVQARLIEARGLPAEQWAIFRRLATDVRMRRVWTELTRRKRPSGSYLHPAKQPPPPYGPALTQEEAQAWALGYLFFCVFHAASDRMEVSKVDNVAPLKAKFLERARVLRESADDLIPPKSNPFLAACVAANAGALRQVAGWYEDAASTKLRQPSDPLVIQNDRGDRVVRGVQILCCSFLNEIFGKRLDRTAATLAAVALDAKTNERVSRSAFSHRKGR